LAVGSTLPSELQETQFKLASEKNKLSALAHITGKARLVPHNISDNDRPSI
jgi:hypothetical protein